MKTIGIVALSGEVDKEKLDIAKINLENMGFNVKLSKNIFEAKRYLAGTDESRLQALYEAFEDPEIDIIISARGGYGAIRLVNKIDYGIIKKNPKIFCGYSDVTALLLMIYKKTGLITYHGPMACSDFVDISEFTKNSFFKVLENTVQEFAGEKKYYAGEAEGILFGGNLTTVTSLCGLDFIPDRDFIFFAEDLHEPVYKIDRMFRQLFNIEKFRLKCKGIVVGEFLETDNPIWLDEMFSELALEFKIPFAGGFKITHGKEKITLPIGKNVLFDVSKLVPILKL